MPEGQLERKQHRLRPWASMITIPPGSWMGCLFISPPGAIRAGLPASTITARSVGSNQTAFFDGQIGFKLVITIWKRWDRVHSDPRPTTAGSALLANSGPMPQGWSRLLLTVSLRVLSLPISLCHFTGIATCEDQTDCAGGNRPLTTGTLRQIRRPRGSRFRATRNISLFP